MNFVGRGAEAILYHKGNQLIKKRIEKGYRLKEIDERLRRERTQREVKLMVEAKRNNVSVPAIIEKDLVETKIVMEFIEGTTLRDLLPKFNATEIKKYLGLVGTYVGRLHKANIVHGDLTTSNMIVRDGELFLVDFGLGEISPKIEAKAVDLRVFKTALESKHNELCKTCFENFSKAYLAVMGKEGEQVLERLKEVEKRGRYAVREG